LLLVVTLVIVVTAVIKNMHIVTPNTVAVISGSKRGAAEGDAVGYRTKRGGRFFLLPVLERVDYISLNLMVLNVEVVNAPSADKVPVNVKAIANVKVNNNEQALGLAIERFLGLTPDKIAAIAKENLESNLRSIVGKMTVEALIADRNRLQAEVLNEAAADLGKMGLTVDLFNIQSMDDPGGYIKTLGLQRTAEVKRDAEIGTANAARDAAIATATANQAGEIARAEAAQRISDAHRNQQVTVATNEVQVRQAQAQVDIRAQVAAATAQADLNQAEVAAQMVRTTAETELADLERKRNDAQMQATVIVKAERERDAAVIEADAKAKAAVREADATKIRADAEAAAIRLKQEGEAQGRTAIAKAVQAEGEAVAEVQRAQMLSTADGLRARALAEAEGVRAKLLAEADGMLKKAEAYKALDEGGRFLMILDASGPAIAAIGKAAAEAFGAVAQPIGQGLAGIDEVRIVDMGTQGQGANPLANFANLPIETLFQLYTKAQAAGFGPALEALAAKAGVTLPTKGA
jgi:flotillin